MVKLIKKLFGFFWDRSLMFFLIIGGANTVLSYISSFLLIDKAGFPFFWGTLLIYAVFSVPSFYFNRKYSFKSKAPLGPSILRFSIIIAGCFFLSYGANQIIMPWLRQNWGWMAGLSDTAYTLVRLLGVQVVFTLLNYVGQRLWAFKAPNEAAPGAETE